MAIVGIENNEKASKNRSEAKDQFKCNSWSATIRDKSQQNTDMLSNRTQFERDDAFG